MGLKLKFGPTIPMRRRSMPVLEENCLLLETSPKACYGSGACLKTCIRDPWEISNMRLSSFFCLMVTSCFLPPFSIYSSVLYSKQFKMNIKVQENAI